MRVQEQRLLIVRPGEGRSANLGGLGVDFKVWGHQTGGRFAIVEQDMYPAPFDKPLPIARRNREFLRQREIG